ncbi:MAG: dienelactone hydrolase family protein [Acidiferrobacteraceae bacterium]
MRALEEPHVRHEMAVYPNAPHGFFCDERDSFDSASRDDAWERALALFASEFRR